MVFSLIISVPFTNHVIPAASPEVKLRALLDSGVSVHEPDATGHFPLHWAAIFGYDWAVKLFLERGAKPTAVNKSGKTALDLALEIGHSEIAKILEQAEQTS